MYTLDFEVKIGEFYLGMVDSITIHKSVELLADTCEIVLPAARLNKALEVEEQIKRGDEVSVSIGYKEVGIKKSLKVIAKISTDGDSIKLFCEDDLFQFRKDLPNEELKKISLSDLLSKVVKGIGKNYKIDCSYTWVYDKFVIRDATGYDVLKKGARRMRSRHLFERWCIEYTSAR